MKISNDIFLIGDPHFGIEFNARGTPLHRRGDRETMQLTQFKSELREGNSLNIMIGDLFDKPFVDLKLVHQIADAYEEAATENPDKLWVLMAGNHDLPRQVIDPKTGLPVKGSFHALARMLKHLTNVMVLFEPSIVKNVVCFPWQWTVSAVEQVEKLNDPLPSIAIGHWDLLDFGGSVEHLCPVSALQARGVTDLFSGHIHIAGDYSGVLCTGSMQPYTHGEDPQGTMYRTLTLDELESIDENELRNMNVRLVLKPNQTLPDLDCLSLVSKVEGDIESIEFETVGLDDFDMRLAVEQQFEQLEVPESVRMFVREKIGAID